MSNPFDALRKVIEHEANQDDDGGFFARLGGLEPDPEDDGPTARGLFQHLGPGETAKLGRRLDDALAQYQPRPAWASKGGRIPCQPLPVRLKDGERPWIQADDQLIEYIHEVDIRGEQWRLRKTGRTTKSNRKPIVAIRKDPDSPYYPWIWSCQICPGQPDLGTNFDKCVDWQSALMHAGNHVRNHHRSTGN